MDEPPFPITRREFQDLYDAFRTLRHDLNNTLAVFMAYSELAQRNPTHYEKLARAVLERGPKVVDDLNGFQAAMAASLGKPPESPLAPPNLELPGA